MIATTIEQGQRLLNAGLSADTADMYWYQWGDLPQKTLAVKYEALYKDELPAWSLSQLWDIMRKADVPYDYSTVDAPEFVIESLVLAIEQLSKQVRIRY